MNRTVRPFVLFDVDDTLIDRRLALAEWSLDFCDRQGLVTGAAQWLNALLKERAAPGDFERVRDRFALSETSGQLWETYRVGIAAAARCHPDVLAGLDGLRAVGWRVGIATNGSADIQWAKLRATGIAERVDSVCVSQEAGSRKPDSTFFREAIRRCRGDTHGPGWMVGDNPVNDICGGRNAGLRTVWVNGSDVWPEGLAGPDHEVSGVRAAIELLAADTQGTNKQEAR